MTTNDTRGSRRTLTCVTALVAVLTGALLCTGCERRGAESVQPASAITPGGSTSQLPNSTTSTPTRAATPSASITRSRASATLQSALSAASADASDSTRSLASAAASSEGNPVP